MDYVLYLVSKNKKAMIERTLLNVLKEKLDYKKALIIFGPRQTGKTTLAKALASQMKQSVEYFNGDAAITKSLWKLENIAALRQSFGTKKIVILDEAQMIEQVGMICKQLIDANLGIQFIITGSSSLNIADKTQEPLTGRKWEYFLYPISSAELMNYQGIPTFLESLPQYLVYGMYPEVVTHLLDSTSLASSKCVTTSGYMPYTKY